MRKLWTLASMAVLALAMNGCMIWDECSSCEEDYWGWDYRWDDDCGCSSCDGWCDCNSSHFSSDDSASWQIDWHLDVESDESQTSVQIIDNGPGSSCMLTRDCASGLICDHHICIDPNDLINDPDIPEIQVECYNNSDCAGDDICTEGRCIPCQTDKCDISQEVQCVFSTQCDSGLCVNGSCLAAGACVVNANCNEGQICSDGECVARPECLSDAECGDGRICNASGSCEDDVECRIDSDCGDSKICVFNMCAECRLDCECPNQGDICMNGVCTAG